MITYAPDPWPTDTFRKPSIFLAGSIEMGKAEPWQDRVAPLLESRFDVRNPRRPDWDSSWPTTKDSPKFREQVLWELAGQESADAILMYFDKDTQSPIALMEIGLFFPTMVVCPEGFWRKGNVDPVCEFFGIGQAPTLDDAIDFLLHEWKSSLYPRIV